MSKDLMNEELLASADFMMDKIRINVYTEGTMKVTQHNPLFALQRHTVDITERALTSDWFTNKQRI